MRARRDIVVVGQTQIIAEVLDVIRVGLLRCSGVLPLHHLLLPSDLSDLPSSDLLLLHPPRFLHHMQHSHETLELLLHHQNDEVRESCSPRNELFVTQYRGRTLERVAECADAVSLRHFARRRWGRYGAAARWVGDGTSRGSVPWH